MAADKGKNLIVLSLEYRDLAEQLERMAQDADGDTLQCVADTLDAESYPVEQKVCAVAYKITQWDQLAAAIKQQVAVMNDRIRVLNNRSRWLRDYLLRGMTISGISKIEGPDCQITVKKNPTGVDIFEPDLIPADYMRAPKPRPAEPDKTAIKAALLEKKDVPGCRLVSGSRVEIK